MHSPKNILKQYWGFDQFRPLQEQIINSVLDGKDALALLPTGGGKSICYQVPALAKDGLCIVVSPLVALMKDQVENLEKKGIHALFIHSGMKYPDVIKTLKNAAYGNYRFLYVSPERIQTRLFLEYLPALKVNLIAVDEAHCISQWGYDFRPSYLEIAKLREELPGVPILALTASATKEVQEDICIKLLFKETNIFRQSFARPNLSYSVFEAESKINKLTEIITKVPGSSIVYCNSRRKTKEVADLLKLNKFNAEHYHAGLNNAERNEKQDKWIRNEINCIVCTNAFGMGIDKPDVRMVIHYDTPNSLESYYQEAGRAGRDGKKAYAVLLYNKEDITTLEQLSSIRFPSAETIRKVYNALMNYLQVPSGTGENQFFDFDLNEFIKRFQLNIHEAIYSIKALEADGHLQFSEQIFLPSSVMFTSNKDSLNEFEKLRPEFDYLVKGLLRTYQGIFDMPVNISEKQLASLLKMGTDSIRHDLQQLDNYGIITFLPAKEDPQVQLLFPRVKTEDLFINVQGQQKRKLAFEKRVEKMLGYLKERKQCRSKMIASYFNDITVEDCGVCDNCLAGKSNKLDGNQFESLRKTILEKIDKTQLTTESLLFQFPGINRSKIKEVMDFLVAEEEIMVDKNQTLIKKKKG